ncbi:SDR family oxidoreductase [Streptomyces albidoflavus]|jgi:NAD(P)-dependent dehydrogenase (short-subunit alcohol dehydrogenase family)|uniref:NAD(P)-dependent oxidoreductase n=1 Tax=Streptomyces albidoflavus TaxID=1886 RepID=D6AZU4_9ACTN|nr:MULTISPECIES: SDR family oxidoreductase [Streptomyces]MYQ73190.1 SDR family oxidoreductase [Streptomyces sp. SID4934]NVI32235.1 SDR family oxidoreductase [Streptomyces sp. CAI-17]SCE07947.1 NAD(P)-dependent dehydrogenase, short-chain alcohol dehydrogenase family [Streptomyces sp. IgraMP-1]BDH49361.1 short-chain dehydrogenase/reductase [Streptomyces albus]AGI86761.1 3-oxoacyl-[acyl-carrier protein] reductase [Streptomyces albidoflavus]
MAATAPVVVVTGAGRGLGLATARRVGADGHRVVLAELDPARGEEAADSLRRDGLDAHFVPCDVADPGSVAAMAEATAALGPVHGLVNNAGLADAVGGKYFHEIDVATWDRIMTVNARGPWLVARALLPHLLAGGGGRIVNVASDAALYGSPRLAHYIASKGALIALTRAMARETGEQGVTVNAVAPGLTESESAERIPAERHELYRLNRAIPRPQRPDDLTGLIAFLIGEESRYITGQTFAVNGGFTMH